MKPDIDWHSGKTWAVATPLALVAGFILWQGYKYMKNSTSVLSNIASGALTDPFAIAADFLRSHEGLRLAMYDDGAGYPTIGYGHKMVGAENFLNISQDQADAMLAQDIKATWNGIAGSIDVDLNNNQAAALICFAFNIGAAGFRGSTLLRKLNAGDFDGASDQFLAWNKIHVNGVLQVSPGLTNRRKDEQALFNA